MKKTNHTDLRDSMKKILVYTYIYRMACGRGKKIGLFIYLKNKQAYSDI